MRCSNVIILSVVVRQTDNAHSTGRDLQTMSSKLRTAVLEQLSGCEETLEQIAKHPDAQAGWPGFTYYSDLYSFYDRHRELILSSLRELAEDLGEDLFPMIQGFFNPKITATPCHLDIAAVLLGHDDYTEEGDDEHWDPGDIKTPIVWWALEHVAHQVADELEQEQEVMI